MANARVEFADGAVALVTASRVARERVRRLRLFQPNGYLSLDLATGGGEFMRLRADWRPGTGAQLADVVERIVLEAPEADALAPRARRASCTRSGASATSWSDRRGRARRARAGAPGGRRGAHDAARRSRGRMIARSAPRIFVSAGEPSGDLHGAGVVRALRARYPDATIEALGGRSMAQAGRHVCAIAMEGLAAFGVVEVVSKMRAHWRLLRALRRRFPGRDATTSSS